jgi:hypothetical protein
LDKFFKTLAKLANGHSPSQKTGAENNCPNIVEGKKTLAMLASEFVFLLANPEFYSHLASWRVVTRTPASATGSSHQAGCSVPGHN